MKIEILDEAQEDLIASFQLLRNLGLDLISWIVYSLILISCFCTRAFIKLSSEITAACRSDSLLLSTTASRKNPFAYMPF